LSNNQSPQCGADCSARRQSFAREAKRKARANLSAAFAAVAIHPFGPCCAPIRAIGRRKGTGRRSIRHKPAPPNLPEPTSAAPPESFECSVSIEQLGAGAGHRGHIEERLVSRQMTALGCRRARPPARWRARSQDVMRMLARERSTGASVLKSDPPEVLGQAGASCAPRRGSKICRSNFRRVDIFLMRSRGPCFTTMMRTGDRYFQCYPHAGHRPVCEGEATQRSPQGVRLV